MQLWGLFRLDLNMHIYHLEEWKHSHRFNIGDERGEQRTKWVIILTLGTMGIEISAGFLFGSMALLADGWHMGTHAVALGITVFAYRYARRHADNPLYSFGTGKVGVLGGFASAVVLAIVALLMAVESIERLFAPTPIQFNEAIAVAVIGLIVNVISAYMLQGHHDHSHQDRTNRIHHDDHNLRAAYLHVLADALTSVLAIVALSTGKIFGWVWMDPMMGVVGGIIIGRWSYGLLRDTSRVLLDRDVSQETVSAICTAIESDADSRVTDIHIWRIATNQLAAIVSLVTHFPQNPEYYKTLLKEFKEIKHLTVEVNHCDGEPCVTPEAGS